MYIIKLVDCASGVERYISKIKLRDKGRKAYNKFETTHKVQNISKAAQFKTHSDAEEALNIALNDEKYWKKRYISEIIELGEIK